MKNGTKRNRGNRQLKSIDLGDLNSKRLEFVALLTGCAMSVISPIYATSISGDDPLFHSWYKHMQAASNPDNRVRLSNSEGAWKLVVRDAREIYAMTNDIFYLRNSLTGLANHYERRKQFERAKTVYREIIDLTSTSETRDEDLIRLADVMVKTGHYNEAEPLYKEAVEVARSHHFRPDLSVFSNTLPLIDCYIKQGKLSEAEKLAKNLAEHPPADEHPMLDNMPALVLAKLARIYVLEEDFLRARQAYDQAMAKYNTSSFGALYTPQSWFDLCTEYADVLEKIGDKSEAQKVRQRGGERPMKLKDLIRDPEKRDDGWQLPENLRYAH